MVWSLLVLAVVSSLIVAAAVLQHHREHRDLADRLCLAAAMVGVAAGLVRLSSSWQELVAMAVALVLLAVAAMGLILVMAGPDVRGDLFGVWRLRWAVWRVDRAARARGVRVVASDPVPAPERPPTARSS